MIEVSFKRPRCRKLIYGHYQDIKSTPKQITYNGKIYFLYGVH